MGFLSLLGVRNIFIMLSIVGAVFAAWWIYNAGGEAVSAKSYKAEIENSQKMSKELMDFNADNLRLLLNNINEINLKYERLYEQYLASSSGTIDDSPRSRMYHFISSEGLQPHIHTSASAYPREGDVQGDL